jgi:hypothetical protein
MTLENLQEYVSNVEEDFLDSAIVETQTNANEVVSAFIIN